MGYTKVFDSGWELSVALNEGGSVVARLTRDNDAYEIVTADTTMLQLPEMGYYVQVALDTVGQPAVAWMQFNGPPFYIWACTLGTASWSPKTEWDQMV